MDISQICQCLGIFQDCCNPLEPVWHKSGTSQASSPGWQAAQQTLRAGTHTSVCSHGQGSAWEREFQGTVGKWNFSVSSTHIWDTFAVLIWRDDPGVIPWLLQVSLENVAVFL